MLGPAGFRGNGAHQARCRGTARIPGGTAAASPLYPHAVRTVNLHELAEERSLALHAAVAERLRADPRLLEAVRARVAGWLRDGTVHEHHARTWAAILSQPLPVILDFLGDRGERARALRQVTPFVGILGRRERLGIRAEVRRRMGA